MNKEVSSRTERLVFAAFAAVHIVVCIERRALDEVSTYYFQVLVNWYLYLFSQESETSGGFCDVLNGSFRYKLGVQYMRLKHIKYENIAKKL